MADSTHYREARLRMDESYAYARNYYSLLQNKVFVEGQIPWKAVLEDPGYYWQEARRAMGEKFSFSFLKSAFVDEELGYTAEEISNDNQLVNSAKIFWLVIYLLAFLVLWGLAALLLLPLYRFVKPVKERVAKEQKSYLALLLACILFVALSFESTDDDMIRKGISIMHTFVWLLMAITTALLIRLDPPKLKNSMRIYLPTIFTALFVITCRMLFVPNAFLNFFLPPLLLVMVLWQLAVNLLRGGKADRPDAIIGWISLGITTIATVCGWTGYVFLSLIILVWWYFQLAFVLAIASVWHLTLWYKEERLDKRLEEYKARITYVSGSAREQLLFSATWFYDLVKEVIFPLLALGSIPTCLYWALDIFEFNDLYRTLFEEPFFRQGEMRVSMYSVLFLTEMFFVFRYANKAVHTIWQSFQYRRFLRKYNRKTIRSNEINLSLGNSLISVFIWFIYTDLFIITLNRSGPQGYPEQLHLRYPAHGRPPAGRGLDRVRRRSRQGDGHQLPDHPGGNHQRHPGGLPELFAVWQELHQPYPEQRVRIHQGDGGCGLRYGFPAGAGTSGKWPGGPEDQRPVRPRRSGSRLRHLHPLWRLCGQRRGGGREGVRAGAGAHRLCGPVQRTGLQAPERGRHHHPVPAVRCTYD